MKKIGLLYREKAIDLVKDNWENSQACILIGFDKVSAFSFNILRNNLKRTDSKILVTKNSLMKRTLASLNITGADDLLRDPTGVVVIKGKDIVQVCKMLVDFSKENAGLTLKGGFLHEQQLSDKELISLSKLPSQEVLLAQAVMTIASPLIGFVATLNNIILKFVWLLEELKKKEPQQSSPKEESSNKNDNSKG